jgi:hypothetical protein
MIPVRRLDARCTRARCLAYDRVTAGLCSALHQPAGLARAAKVGHSTTRLDLGDGTAAGRTGLPALAVHSQKVAHLAVDVRADALPQRDDGLAQHRLHRLVQADALGVGERRPLAVGVYPGGETDFVGVGVADAGHRPAMGKNTLNLGW